jgi:hypothetical protein
MNPAEQLPKGISDNAKIALESAGSVLKLLPIVVICMSIAVLEKIDLSTAYREYLGDRSDNDKRQIVSDFVRIGTEGCPFKGVNIAEFIPMPMIQHLVFKMGILLPPICKLNILLSQYEALIDTSLEITKKQTNQHYSVELSS